MALPRTLNLRPIFVGELQFCTTIGIVSDEQQWPSDRFQNRFLILHRQASQQIRWNRLTASPGAAFFDRSFLLPPALHDGQAPTYANRLLGA